MSTTQIYLSSWSMATYENSFISSHLFILYLFKDPNNHTKIHHIWTISTIIFSIVHYYGTASACQYQLKVHWTNFNFLYELWFCFFIISTDRFTKLYVMKTLLIVNIMYYRLSYFIFLLQFQRKGGSYEQR
jgi:hypothetical protein